VIRLAAAALALAYAAGSAAGPRLSIATWNLEWMVTPETFDALAPSCFGREVRAPGRARAIPCDLVPRGRWSVADLARIRAFASTLPADVIALQEIDGAEAARRIFPDREFCFTARRHVQNVGFAIRQGLASAATATTGRSGCRMTTCAGAQTSRSNPARRKSCACWPCT
jgi:hypothetical protein